VIGLGAWKRFGLVRVCVYEREMREAAVDGGKWALLPRVSAKCDSQSTDLRDLSFAYNFKLSIHELARSSESSSYYSTKCFPRFVNASG
jgi:hypothetical protein